MTQEQKVDLILEKLSSLEERLQKIETEKENNEKLISENHLLKDELNKVNNFFNN